MSGDVASEPGGRSITITMKYGKGFEEPWAVFRGLSSEVREDIITFFGFDRESVADLTLDSIVANGAKKAQAVRSASTALGGTVISEGTSSASEPTGDAAWATAESTPQAPDNAGLLKAIAETDTTDALKRLWAENQALFADAAGPEMTAWKARGKALKEAA